METDDVLNNESEIEPKAELTDEVSSAEIVESDAAEIAEDGVNLEICPNCLEPNTDNLAVCRYCGMPLHQGADPDVFEHGEDEAKMAAARAQAAPEEKKPEKKQESGFRRVMPWLGLYLIYYAVTGCFDISRQIKQAVEEGQTVNAPLAYLSQGIWFAAGLLMAWPLIMKGYRKLRHLPEPDDQAEPAEKAEAESAPVEDVSDAAAETLSQNEEPINPEAEDEPQVGKEADEKEEDTTECE